MLQDDIVRVAQSYLKTPFRHQGRVPGLGMDCAGLYVCLCQELGIPHADASGYPRTPYDGKLESELDAQPSLVRIAKEQACKGDLLAMRITGAPQHIAIHAGHIGGHPYVIHASEQHGGVVLHRIDELWGVRIVRAYRFEVSQ